MVMYEIVLRVIESGSYDLRDITKKVDTLWVQGNLTEDQRNELLQKAREKAKPEYSYDPLQSQIEALAIRVSELERRVSAIESGSPEDPPVDPGEYPEYKKPSGAHDAYNIGDKVTFEGEHYECIMDGCVWNPTEYPQGWKKV